MTDRYRLPGSVMIVSIVDVAEFNPNWPELFPGWVWVRPSHAKGARLMAAEKATLQLVGEPRDLRTIGGGLTVHHDVVANYITGGKPYDIPVLRFEGRADVLLRKDDVDGLVQALVRMRGEMPPEPYMPSGTLLS